MNKTNKSKPKLKRYYMKKSIKETCVTTNIKGFLCSCNNREKDCIKESYNILNEYADKLYPQDKISSVSEEIDDQLKKELSELKSSKERRFQVLESGAKNFLFIRTTLENPVELAETIIKDIQQTGNKKTRFLLRLVPVEITCKANIEDMVKAFANIADKHFNHTAKSFSIMFNHRNNNSVAREDIIKTVANKVFEFQKGHRVDLKTADLSIIVEVIKGFAFLSVIPNYLKYKKYNLSSICDQIAKTEEKATDDD